MIYNDLLGNRKHSVHSFSCPTIVNFITLSLSKLNPAIIPPQNCKTLKNYVSTYVRTRQIFQISYATY